MARAIIEYYGANKRLLFRGVVPASPGDGNFSFFGVVFEGEDDEALIAKVRITTGNSAPGPEDNERRDIVMMDDFIYGEPQPEDDERAESPSEETAGITAATDESTSSAEDQGTTTAADEGTTSATAESQILTVVNGSASGNTPGTVVTVTADDPPAGQEFAGWTGDVDILANSSLSTTTATLPSTTQVTITATYRSASATQP